MFQTLSQWRLHSSLQCNTMKRYPDTKDCLTSYSALSLQTYTAYAIRSNYICDLLNCLFHGTLTVITCGRMLQAVKSIRGMTYHDSYRPARPKGTTIQFFHWTKRAPSHQSENVILGYGNQLTRNGGCETYVFIIKANGFVQGQPVCQCIKAKQTM